MTNSLVSRRSFLNTLGTAVAVSAIPGLTSFAYAADQRIVFVAAADGIHTMECLGSGWCSRSFVHADAPSAMALSTNKKTLYVANATECYRGLPTGSVTAYHVAAGGMLHMMGSSQLALSAVRPYALTVSPDNSLLAVASEGGVLSLLGLQWNGHLGKMIAAHKRLTSEQLMVTFHTDELLRLDDGTAGCTFRVSPQNGLALVSTGPSEGVKASTFETFGVKDAKAALYVVV